jgi:predicted nucleic acid-binding protein
MPGKARRVYWDANLYLSYLNGDSDRLPTLDALVKALRTTDDMEVVTSTLSITEVAFGQEEQGTATLDQTILEQIDFLWKDTSIVKLVDVSPMIAYDARGLMRDAITRKWSLKPPDAIHFATARLLRVSEFLTYEDRLYKYEPLVGFPVREPYVTQPMLPLDPTP